MSYTTDLTINNYPIYSPVNTIDETVISIFSRKELKVKKDKNDFKVYFERDAKILKQRLNMLGFSIELVKALFDLSTVERADLLREDDISVSHNEIEIILNPFASFLKALRIIITDKLFEHEYNFSNSISDIISYLLEDGSSSLPVNFPHYTEYGMENFDIRNFIRVALEVVPDDYIVRYDISIYVWENDFDGDFDELYNIVYPKKLLVHTPSDKILIICEGKTDVDFIKRSMNLLYPEYCELYYFMDFDISKVEGSVSAIVKLIKAFIGVDLKAKVIALFDNDSAAENELLNLKDISIPYNIKLIKYPKLTFAENYPTNGPEGLKLLDINGRACSIELYLGKEIISSKNEFVPVQWTGYISRLEKYQGEITKKGDLQKKFKSKLRDCEKENSKVCQYDWEGMKMICKEIFNAFK